MGSMPRHTRAEPTNNVNTTKKWTLPSAIHIPQGLYQKIYGVAYPMLSI